MADYDARTEIDSLISWWQIAGVDIAIDEMPRSWLTQDVQASTSEPERIDSARPAPAPTPVEIHVADLPDTLGAFLAWLATDMATLAAYPVARRVVPTIVPVAELMVVADIPETGDAEAQRLLSGEVGLLIDRMLAAMGRDRGSVHLATIAPARPALGRLDDTEQALLAPILRRHVALVAPKKLWLLGRAASRALLGMDETQAAGRLHSVNQDGVMMDAIATVHPRILLREPKLKARVWEDMKRLIEGPTT